MAQPAERSEGDLYVGYLPTPRAHRRLLRTLLPALAALLATVGVVAALSQRDPGDGVWETGPETTIEGVMRLSPYPHLVREGERVLLVEENKFGAQARTAALDGRRVRAVGHALTRDGRLMLELIAGDDALTDQGPAERAGSDRASGRETLLGEIVDSKCYHGAMKPGDGKTHKACAILCIRGGIPPVLIVASAGGGTEAVLLSSRDGGPVGEWLLPFVGEPVAVQGEVVVTPQGRTLRIAPGDIALR